MNQYPSTKVRAVLAQGIFLYFDAADWYDMALACLDQAGFTKQEQKLFEMKFERPEDGVL